jgi:hypothetical protein
MIRWDDDSKVAVNHHFASVTELHRTMGYIGNLSIEDVLKSVFMATLKASTNRFLRDAYHKVLDDLDDYKDLSFALIQDDCARQTRRHPDERHPAAWSCDHPGTPLCHQGPPAATRTTLNKTRPQPGDGVSAFLCNFLDNHGVKPAKVLKKAGLRHETQAAQFRKLLKICQPSNPTNFGLVFRSPQTLRVFGELMSNISATRGRPNMRFCVCGSPRRDLSHIAGLTLGRSRSDFSGANRRAQDHTCKG